MWFVSIKFLLAFLCERYFTNGSSFFLVSQEEFVSLRNDSGSRTTIIIKMKGDVDIMVTPLIFESLQR